MRHLALVDRHIPRRHTALTLLRCHQDLSCPLQPRVSLHQRCKVLRPRQTEPDQMKKASRHRKGKMMK